MMAANKKKEIKGGEREGMEKKQEKEDKQLRKQLTTNSAIWLNNSQDLIANY
jgi:hypothetical protein